MSRTLWHARHEFRLAWRDFIGMVTAGKPRRGRIAIAVILGFAAFMHLIAWKMVGRYADITFPPDRETLVALTGSALLSCTVMVSQAMESVTRAFYSRADLDLLMSSPAPTRPIFMLRTAASGVAASVLALVLIGPFINALALAGGARWLSAYGVLLALAAASTAFAVGLTVLLFRMLGARRTRFVAQVVAAIVGAVFVIGVQVVSIYAYGNLSRVDAFHSELALRLAPDPTSLFWLPARAAMGDPASLVIVIAAGALMFTLAVSVASRRFGEFSLAAAGVGMGSVRQKAGRPFRRASAAAALRRKEWTLLARDPWLMSQTLMQILYLIPPALLLWHNYGAAGGALVVTVPVLVMAAGQLAGGLAWLAISGEDAPDLVSTAPVRRNAVLRAKVEAVIGLVAIVLGPIVLALATASPWTAIVAAVGVLCAAASATAIQLFFRAQAKRSHFRRRQTSSRIATFAEAFSSVGWAATAGLAAAGSPLAALTAASALAIIAAAAAFRPRRAIA
jgi:ABC-2 type transport system permease protein